MSNLKPIIAKVAAGQKLYRDEARTAFDIIMAGEGTAAQIGGLLVGLRVRGETVDEITGAVQAMRGRMLKVDAPESAMDIVGTGGDGSGSYNVSTATAFVVAGCGVPVAKHGNRALSSRSGAADTLTALGVKVDVGPEVIADCISKAGIGFMFAPVHHPAMRHVGPMRVELGIRTIFNLIGPLSNPAGVTRQLLGVYSQEWVEPLAHVLLSLGTQSAWVVHGDGFDEMTTTGQTHVAAIEDGHVRLFTVTPEDIGLMRAAKADLTGGEAADNALALRGVLNGETGPYRDIVLLNAAASLVIAGKAASLIEGKVLAEAAIDSGAARQALERLIAVSNSAG